MNDNKRKHNLKKIFYVRNLFFSASIMAAGFLFIIAWSFVITLLTNSDNYSIGNIKDMLITMNGGGVILLLSFLGSFWLLLADNLNLRKTLKLLSERHELFRSNIDEKR